jgi:hypothetical protein
VFGRFFAGRDLPALLLAFLLSALFPPLVLPGGFARAFGAAVGNTAST